MAEKYSIESVTDYKKWDEFVEKSPEGTFFSKYVYLETINRKFDLFYILSGTEVRAGVALIKTEDGFGYDLDDTVIYNGIFYSPPKPNQKQNGVYSEQFSLIDFFINQISNKAKKMEISLSPQIIDIRPFLWYNYHSSNENEKFRSSIRYTSYMDISEFSKELDEEKMNLFNNLDMKRRQSIRKARKSEAITVESEACEILIEFYIQTLEKQNKAVSEFKTKQMRSLVSSSIAKGYGKLFIAYNNEKLPVSASHFLFDSKRAYYMFGASSPSIVDDSCGTIVLWDAFKSLNQIGINCIDMEGINSPKRGWFKLSFGGDIKPYYEVSYGL